MISSFGTSPSSLNFFFPMVVLLHSLQCCISHTHDAQLTFSADHWFSDVLLWLELVGVRLIAGDAAQVITTVGGVVAPAGSYTVAPFGLEFFHRVFGSFL